MLLGMKKRKAIKTLPKRTARFLHIQVYSKSNSDPSLWANICFLLKSHQPIQIFFFFFFINLKGHLIWFFFFRCWATKKNTMKTKNVRGAWKSKGLRCSFPSLHHVSFSIHVWMPEFRAWQGIVYFYLWLCIDLFFILFFSLTARMFQVLSKVCLLSLNDHK